MNPPVVIIPKNSLDSVHVTLASYKGHDFIDIRQFAVIDMHPDPVPTRKGVAIPPTVDALDALIDGLARIRTIIANNAGNS